MKYLIDEDLLGRLKLTCPIVMLRRLESLKPIEPLSDEQIYAIWPYPEGTNSVQALARAIEAHILGEKV